MAATLVIHHSHSLSSFSCLSLSLSQSSGDELDEFEVELYKEGRGLGITIAGLVSEDTGGQSLPINTHKDFALLQLLNMIPA